MPRKTILTPWQEMEQQAYDAYREWPLFLKLRLRELRKHLPEAFTPAPEPVGDTSADTQLLRKYGLMSPGTEDP